MATTSATSTTGTNIDVAGIVSQLMTVEQRPLTQLATKEASYQAKLSAYGTIKGALSSFQGSLTGLSNISAFQAMSASSSNSSAVSVAASSTAATGSYTLNVTKLAQAQQLVAAGQSSSSAAIGTGASTTLTFDFGTINTSATNSHGGGSVTGGVYTNADFTSNGNGAKTVTIDSTNNSLQGISNAINSANIGVTASIVNDGGTSPYRLVLSSASAGANNSLKISVAGVSGAPADTALSNLLSQDPANNSGQKLSETTAAQNAEFTINGIAVSKNSNTVTDSVQGVTLNLLSTTTAPVNVSVSQNTSSIATSVKGFVTAYNSLYSTLKSASAYNASTQTGAVLQGDFTVISLQSQIHSVLNASVTGNSGSVTSLSQIGVTFQKDGTLGLDTTKLNAAVSSNFSDVASLFATVGTASDSLVKYNASTSGTKPGNYALNVTAVATQGSITGNVNLNTVNDGVNGVGITAIASGTTINAFLNGTSASVALAAGTYNPTQLATMIQSAINGTTAFAGSSVSASVNSSGFLQLTSNLYGSPSGISISDGAGTSVANFYGAGTSTPGMDVAGSIGGNSATGSGQFLTGTSGDSSGLQIQVNGGTTGARGTVNYAQGYAYTLSQLTTSMLSTGGLLDSVTSGINRSITDIGKQRTALNARLVTVQANYTKQFSALDTMLSSMNTTSNYLTQQLANLPKAN